MNEKTANITIAFDVFAYLDVLQTWSETEELTGHTLAEIVKIVDEKLPAKFKGKIFNEKLQQLKTLVATNPELNDYILVNQSAQNGYETGHLCANVFQNVKTGEIHVAYR